MTHSENATALIKRFEGCELFAYLDGNQIPTIGYGHTEDVQMGQTCTMAQAEDWLNEDLSYFDVALTAVIAVTVNQNQWDALISFVYNIGPGHFDGSSCKRLLNQGDYAGACTAMALWNRVAGNISAGLVRRRKAEQELFSEAM